MNYFSILLNSLIFANIKLLLCLFLGQCLNFSIQKYAKIISGYALILTFLFLFYLMMILFFSFYNLLEKNYTYSALFLIFFLAPFVIGHFASYKKINLLIV